jgi:4-hydroxyproline epimerase
VARRAVARQQPVSLRPSGVGDSFVHESYIGSRFTGRVEAAAKVGNHDAIVPSIEGSAIATGYNTIFIDEADPFWRGFQVR